MTADLAKSPMPDPDANAVAWFIRDKNKGVPGKAFSPDTATADLKMARHLSRFNFTIQPLVLRETMEAEIKRLHKQLETANGEIAMLRDVLELDRAADVRSRALEVARWALEECDADEDPNGYFSALLDVKSALGIDVVGERDAV